MIPKNYQQLKQISIYLLVIHCLRVVYLMQKKLDPYRGKDYGKVL